MKIIKTDCLVIGSGLAGSTAALELSTAGVDTVVVTRAEKPEISNTYYAQGGIIFTSDDDSPKVLKEDILKAGDYLCNTKAVDDLIQWGPKLVKEILIEKVGIKFDQSRDGSYDLTEEGGHSLPRIIHVGDYTGKSIEDRFIKYLSDSKKVLILAGCTGIDLLTLAHHSKDPLDVYKEPSCIGAYIYDQKKREVFAVVAKETILATGGLGQIFLHTSNPDGSRGDGFSMAARAGARLINMEYIQFHPTTLYSESTNERFLISETLRGEGARLLNRERREFMHNYHEKGSLAPRDVVARGIHEEMLKENTEYLYLDISFKPEGWIKKRFPNIYNKCFEQGIDITKNPIPVVPAAHYSCGGVSVDSLGKSSLRHLRCVGEVSCTGVHGANRLASTSLLEDVVWGSKAGRDVAQNISKNSIYLPEVKEWLYEREEVDPALLHQDWLTIKHTMWNYAGLVRTKKRLARAQSILSELAQEIETFYANGDLSDPLIGLRNGIRTANIVLNAAAKNRESRGCHYYVKG